MLKSTKSNIITTIAVALILFIIFISTNILGSTGLDGLVILWLPFVFAIISMIFYFIIKHFSKKYAFIATILGIIFQIVLLVNLTITK